METKTSVCFPYRSDKGQRKHIADWVMRRWTEFFPEFELIRGTCDDGPFNRSQAINNAFRQSSGATIIIADLDTIFHMSHVIDALTMSRNYNIWGFPFRSYFNLTQAVTDEILGKCNPRIDIPLQEVRFWNWGNENVSGVVVCPRDAFIEIGGYDEGFVGWGYEDLAFAASAEHRWGKPFRIEWGYVLHLNHSHAGDVTSSESNRRRFEDLYLRGNLDDVPRWLS